MNELIKRIWRKLVQGRNGAQNSLSKEEARLMTTIRLAPQDDLTGHELVVAKALAGKGLLRQSTGKKYQLTEKGHVALRAQRG